MSAVLYRLRSTLMLRWRTWLLLTLTIAAVSGVVLAAAAGARRTDTAPDRFTAARGGDVDATIVQQDGGLPITEQLRALPAVQSADGITFVFGGLIPAGSDKTIDALPFTGTVEGARGELVAGRAPDPDAAGEFVATPSFVAAAGASIGDSFQLVTLTPEEAFTDGFDSATQSGPRMTAELVGIIDTASQIEDPTPTVLFSEALLASTGDGGGIATSQSNIAVELRDGFDLIDLRQQLDTLPGSESLAISSGQLIGEDVRTAVNTQAVGLWILTLVAAGASIVVLGQLVLRTARVTSADTDRLNQIGATTRDVLAESFGRALVPILLGCAAGIAFAVVPSAIFPTGFARSYEPDAGVHVDVPTLTVGALLLASGLGVWTGLGLYVGSRSRSTAGRPSSVEGIAARSPSIVASTGLRFAFARRPTGRSGASGVVLAISTGTALLVAALVFGFSMNRLIDEPFRYGINYDFAAGDDGSGEAPTELIAKVSEAPAVSSAILYASDHARRGDSDVELLGMQQLRGSGAPVISTGSLPATSQEIVLGRVTARDLGFSVGDSLDLVGVTGTGTFEVTGIGVIPGFGANEGVGSGAILLMEGLARLNEAARPNVLAVSINSGSGADDVVRDFAAFVGVDPSETRFRPAVIVNAARVRNIPFALAALLGALSLLTVANVVVSSVRHRRRELAILRSLGASGGWIGGVVHWQASILVMAPALIGAGLGVALGRQVFIAFAADMGAIDHPSVPAIAIALLVAGLVLVANFAAMGPGRAVRRSDPAARLRAE